jgi:N-acetylmuramoyl-L-alanine amidase
MKWTHSFASALALVASIATAAAQSGPVATIKDIRRSVLPDAVRVIIELDREVPFHDERIPDPLRVFVDLPGTRAVPALADHTIRYELDADIVRQVRLGRHPNNTTRVVLDATDVSSYSVYPLYDPFRIVIDCVRSTAVHTTAAVPPRPPTPQWLIARSLAPSWNRVLPRRSPGATRLLTAAYATMVRDANAEPASTTTATTTTATLVDSPPVITSTPVLPPSAPPAKNMNGGFSMSRQLGLGVSRIVIDPGHGGHDPGASGKGVEEAELVLDVALRLEKLLQKAPGVEVILTRRTDEFIPLQERTAIANREGADLFLSIHANANSNPQARGIETYFLNFANNLSAAAVAARENAASGQTMGALPDLVKAIALNNKLDESRDFATHIQRMMFDRLRGSNSAIKDLGVKQAPFVVLIGAAMPSVLAEISFVTNPQEARLLKGAAYRQRIAEALFNAIRKYQTSLKNGTAVASQ